MDQFHFMLAYRFQNARGRVRTSWLDIFDRRFRGGSGTHTYTIYQRVARQYYNYQMTLIEQRDFTPRIGEVLERLLQTYPIRTDFNEFLVYQLANEYIRQFNDNNERYNNNQYTPYHYIRQQIEDYNQFIRRLSGFLDLAFPIPVPRQIELVETKNIIPKPIQMWYERNPILTHRKGYRGFVKDYEYRTHW